jgi:hypothetical protein
MRSGRWNTRAPNCGSWRARIWIPPSSIYSCGRRKAGSSCRVQRLRGHREARVGPFTWTKTVDEILDKMRRFGLRASTMTGFLSVITDPGDQEIRDSRRTGCVNRRQRLPGAPDPKCRAAACETGRAALGQSRCFSFARSSSITRDRSRLAWNSEDTQPSGTAFVGIRRVERASESAG